MNEEIEHQESTMDIQAVRAALNTSTEETANKFPDIAAAIRAALGKPLLTGVSLAHWAGEPGLGMQPRFIDGRLEIELCEHGAGTVYCGIVIDPVRYVEAVKAGYETITSTAAFPGLGIEAIKRLCRVDRQWLTAERKHLVNLTAEAASNDFDMWVTGLAAMLGRIDHIRSLEPVECAVGAAHGVASMMVPEKSFQLHRDCEGTGAKAGMIVRSAGFGRVSLEPCLIPEDAFPAGFVPTLFYRDRAAWLLAVNAAAKATIER